MSYHDPDPNMVALLIIMTWLILWAGFAIAVTEFVERFFP